MEIRELRAFVAVVQEGALSAAARRLHLSQSALTQTMQGLERQLGVQLLVRNHTGVTPTAAGQVLLGEASALIDQHNRAVRAVTAVTAETATLLRIGVPLELPANLLPAVLARLTRAHPRTRIEMTHASSRAQLAALRAGELDVALVRDRPADPVFDAVVTVKESMGVILAADRAAELAETGGVQLHRLAGLRWTGFPRTDSPAWYDQVTAILRGHGIEVDNLAGNDERPVIAEVKLAAVGTGNAFAFASPGWSQPLPDGLAWFPLIGDPIIRRTWAVWIAASSRRDLGSLIEALDLSSPSA